MSRADIQTEMMAMMQGGLDLRMSQLNIEAAEDDVRESEDENERRDGEECEEEEEVVWDVVWRYIF